VVTKAGLTVICLSEIIRLYDTCWCYWHSSGNNISVMSIYKAN